MSILLMVVYILYFVCVSLINLFCISQLVLFVVYIKRRSRKLFHLTPRDLPLVTVQLPIFNERYVAERLISSVCQLDYPKDKIQIQILDDSTDDTSKIIDQFLNTLTDTSLDISVKRREDRQGYKAGALQAGLAECKGEFICIFDADFTPEPSFLMKTIPYFENEKIGVIQTRWTHLNEDENLLTKLQALQLNVHFTAEQAGRYHFNKFLQFNGTAGIWRKEAIYKSGGWQEDTLTEDLDLSYRAQLNNYDIIFLEDVLAPAELPSEIGGLKSQQFRWMKGGAQSARKLLPDVWNSEKSLGIKLWASIHLLGSSIYSVIFVMSLLSLFIMLTFDQPSDITRLFGYLFTSLPMISFIYYYVNVFIVWESKNKFRQSLYFIAYFPLFLALSIGFSFHNSIAVIQGWSGKKSGFKRTPKKGETQLPSYSIKISNITYLEGIFALLFGVSVIYQLGHKQYGFLYFHLICFLGYFIIFYLSLISKYKNNAARQITF